MEKKNQPNKTIEIVVTADIVTGRVNVQGPLAHKSLCVKALATAIQIVADHVSPVIHVPTGPKITPIQNGGSAS